MLQLLINYSRLSLSVLRMTSRGLQLAAFALAGCLMLSGSAVAQSRYAASDNLSGYVHWIELLDANNNRIDPNSENPAPYSPEQTCGRCHDFKTIAHGWHFNAVDSGNAIDSGGAGRPGQPWVWSDSRTGTHLPLSYRDWPGTVDPDAIGLSRWQVAAKFGGFLPGGGPGAAEALASSVPPSATDERDAATASTTDASESTASESTPSESTASESEATESTQGSAAVDSELTGYVDRSHITGPLPVDCMICHHRPGSGYSPFVWTEQIEDENFAYAPTAATGMAVVSGSIKRLKDDFDPAGEEAASRLPQVAYDADRFRSDGKVFFDVIRKPDNSACYYCHSNLSAGSVQGERWLHDEDIHVRAGLKCADCHRNGLDHHTVRGYAGEQHPSGTSIASLSCQGCHLGSSPVESLADTGRLGAPRPAHRGLPSVHFEKLSCTACHAGPTLADETQRQLNSIIHRLGTHEKRTGDELPGITASVILPVRSAETPIVADDESTIAVESSAEETSGAEASSVRNLLQQVSRDGTGQYTPHRMLWPSYWGTIQGEQVRPLNPELAYELVRRELKVRRDFIEDLSDVKLSLKERTELLGDAARARLKPEDWTDAERATIAKAEEAARKLQIAERVSAALAAIEAKYPGETAVFVTGGVGMVRDGEKGIKQIDDELLFGAAEPYAWPLGHNVRSAQQSLGATGCTECHSNQAAMFQTAVRPVGVLPGQETEPIAMYQLQGSDMERLQRWNELFAGRASFKIAGLIALGLTALIVLATLTTNLSRFFGR